MMSPLSASTAPLIVAFMVPHKSSTPKLGVPNTLGNVAHTFVISTNRMTGPRLFARHRNQDGNDRADKEGDEPLRERGVVQQTLKGGKNDCRDGCKHRRNPRPRTERSRRDRN